jgi:hypothetical protein
MMLLKVWSMLDYQKVRKLEHVRLPVPSKFNAQTSDTVQNVNSKVNQMVLDNDTSKLSSIRDYDQKFSSSRDYNQVYPIFEDPVALDAFIVTACKDISSQDHVKFSALIAKLQNNPSPREGKAG